MKKITFCFAMIVTLSTLGANIECTKIGGWLRPVNNTGIELAKTLKVKTCGRNKMVQGVLIKSKFALEAAKEGHTIKIVKPTKANVTKYVQARL